MATVADSLKRSSLNIGNISKSLTFTKKSISATNSSVENISKIVANNTRVKNELFERSLLTKARRAEASRRKELEDQIEASDVSTSPSRGLSFAGSTDKGPLGRLLSFLGYITAGWIVENLPTWIFMGKEFISRIQKFGTAMVNSVNDIYSALNSFGSLLTNSLSAIINFDFEEFTEGSVAQSFDDLNLSIKNLGTDITDTFKLFTTPLNESIDTGEKAPELGEPRTESLYAQPSTGGVSVSGYGTKEQQALLKAIRFAEGTAGPTGYSMFFGDRSGQAKYGDLTKLSANQVEQLVTRFLNDPQSKYGSGKSAAVGAYQIIDITSKARSLGMDMNRKFDQSFQDEMALRLAASRGVTAEVLRREGLSESVIKKLSPEWASFPGNTYGQPTKRVRDIQLAYSQGLSAAQTAKPAPSTATRSPAPSTTGGGLKSIGGGHRLQASAADAFLKMKESAAKQGVNLTLTSSYRSREEQQYLYNLYLSGKGNLAAPPGRSLHEKGIAIDVGNGIPWMQKYASKFGWKNTGMSFSQKEPWHFDFQGSTASLPSPPSPSPSPAQIASMTQRAQMVPPALTPERVGPNVSIIDNRMDQGDQYMPAVTPPINQTTTTLNESDLLNNFIKNKLLLDLSYT